MAARAAKGLSAADLETLRAQVDAGRRPKVVFTANAGQIAGQAGQVTALDDPAASDEWITVRFGKDELPFAPGDLQLAPKPAKNAPAKATRKRAEPAPEPHPELPAPRSAPTAAADAGGRPAATARAGGDGPAASGTGRPAATARTGAAAGDGRPGPAPRQQARATGAAPSAGGDASTGARPAAAAARSASGAGNAADARHSAGAAAARPVRKAGKGKGPAELAVTLSWRDGDWTVQAQRGSRVVARPAPVRAADALRMVGMLDAPEVAEIVAEIVETERAAAREQAERLRQELAAVEAKLAELP